MPTTILDGETYEQAKHRRFREEAEYAKRFQHTPGPWRIERTHDLWLEIRNGHGLVSTMVADCVADRDANLIAAAPDLLEALQGFLVMTEGQSIYHFMEPQQKAAKAAIAKALGDTLL